MDYVRTISAITLCASILFSKTLFASCYDTNNAFDADGDIIGLAVTFSNGVCNRSSPYEILISRDSVLKNSTDIKFTISESDRSLTTNKGKNIIRFYSNQGLSQDLLYEIYIKNTSDREISLNTYLSDVTATINKDGTTYTLSNIDLSRVSKIQFGDDVFVGKIDDIQYAINDSNFQPIIAIKPYKLYPTGQGVETTTMKLAAIPVKLIDKIVNKSIIYYDPDKDSNNPEAINCKDNYVKFGNLGYYFEKNEEKELIFEGCCFLSAYGALIQQGLLKISESIEYDIDYVGVDKKKISSKVQCANGGSASGDLSYYFDKEDCNIKLYGICNGDGIIPESGLITECSTKQVDDVVQKSDGTDDDIEINCKIGCENSGELNYNLSSSTAVVTISGVACNKKTKTLQEWAVSSGKSIPKGINGGLNAQYMFNENTNTLSCIPGYEDGTIIYKFQDNLEVIIFTGSCTPKKYRLDSYDNWESISGLTNLLTVDYDEDKESAERRGPLTCISGYESDGNLGYYFNGINTDGEPNLVINGNCNRKQYALNDYGDFNRLIAIDGSISVSYDENKNSIASMGSLNCNSNYRSDGNLGYYFNDINDDGELDLVINGNCVLDDENSVLADYNALNFDMIKQGNSDINNIKTQLNLVTSGSNGTNISWSSSDYSIGDNNGGIRGGDGVVIRPNPGVATNNVTLYANISKGNESMQKSFALQVAPYNEYSRYVGYGSYQNNGWGWDSIQYYSSEQKNNYTDCATSCKNDRYCMFAFWRHSSGKICKKFSNVNNKDHGSQTYNDNLRYYKY
tara:strand:- start:5063 stop:7453 length:2391 start_codon:yes stop_codon:yes gene_type:complete